MKPGDVLLSHGEAPHYHRRYCVSLLSSAWNQVGPQRYGRQAKFYAGADTQTRTGDLILTKDALYHLSYISIILLKIFISNKVFKAWRCPTLTWGSPTLPSALLRFTSEFGMESGGSTTLWSPSKFLIRKAVIVFSTHSILFLL